MHRLPLPRSAFDPFVWNISKHLPPISFRLIMFFCLIFIPNPSSPLAQPLSDGIAAIVNSEVITLSELEQELKDEILRLRAKFSGKTLRQKLTQKEYAVLNRLIERKLQVQEAKAKGLTITEEEFQRAMDQLRKRQAPNTSADHLSEKFIREELLITKLLDFEVRRNLMVGPGELLSYYENSQDQFMEPPDYHLRQILLLPKFDETEDMLQRRATQLLEKIRGGQSFAEVAQLYSDGPESTRGGDLGYVRKNELLDSLASTLDRLKPGEVSGPIRSTLGIHIILVEDIKSGAVQSFEDVKNLIQSILLQRKTHEAHQQWLSSLKDKAYIEIKL